MTLVLSNANLVLPDRVMHGGLEAGPLIQSITTAQSGGIDCEGDYVLPGAIDLHTDNLERQVQPRQKTRWPSRSAMLIHDAQCAAAGITTVFDALCVGDLGFDEDRHRSFVEGARDLIDLQAVLKIAHYLHLRCELPAPDMLEKFELAANHPALRLISLMDHTPGFGQYADIERYKIMREGDGEAVHITEARIASLQAQRIALRAGNRAALLARVAGLGIKLATHDDRSAEEVAENIAAGIGIAEFPVTREAALAARAGGQGIIAGAPNVVRGGSHTGNVAVADLVREKLVDVLASDYVPASLIEAAFMLPRGQEISLPDAVKLITSAPAAMAGLDDRGAIAPGLRADLVRVKFIDGMAIVRAVWCQGVRVA